MLNHKPTMLPRTRLAIEALKEGSEKYLKLMLEAAEEHYMLNSDERIRCFDSYGENGENNCLRLENALLHRSEWEHYKTINYYWIVADELSIEDERKLRELERETSNKMDKIIKDLLDDIRDDLIDAI